MKNTYEQHGKTGTRLYVIWGNIVQRCTNPKNSNYPAYSSRGICNQWRESFVDFEIWALNNGYRPDLTIDRKDNNKGYFPDNCRWTTKDVQASNRDIQRNNSSGYIGVTFESNSRNINKWLAGIRVNGKRKNLGRYSTPEAAAQARNVYIITNNLTNYTKNKGVPK